MELLLCRVGLLPGCLTLFVSLALAQKFGDSQLVYEWKFVDFVWPSREHRQQALDNGSYLPERSLLAGIKVYRGEVYLTIPRWIWTSGQPVTLAKVVTVGSQHLLQPYPSWAAQRQGDCAALQYVQSMEIDPNTGYMYVLDTGRVGSALNLCPAKVVIYDLNNNVEVSKYEFPDEVVGRMSNFLNDIVLDYVDGRVKFVYITNTDQGRITVYDVDNKSSHYFEHSSMSLKGGDGSLFSINGKNYNFSVAVDGIAMSPDFKHVYYCVLSGYDLYQVPTSTLREPGAGSVGFRPVGRKISQTDGMYHGSRYLFYGALGLNSVYYWDVEADLSSQKVGLDQVKLATQMQLVRDNVTTQWPDTFGFDEYGWIWFVSNRLQESFTRPGLPQDGDASLRVWRVYVNQTSYLSEAHSRTQPMIDGRSAATNGVWSVPVVLTVLAISSFINY